MMRFRRYRVSMICAFIIVVLLYHVSKNSQWDAAQGLPFEKAAFHHISHAGPKTGQVDRVSPQRFAAEVASVESNPLSSASRKEEDDDEDDMEPGVKIPELKTDAGVRGGYALPPQTPPPPTQTTKQQDSAHKLAVDPVHAHASPATKAAPAEDAAGKDVSPYSGSPADSARDRDEGVHVDYRPGSRETPVLTRTSTIHWEKPTEWFPVPEESIIPLPTGNPKQIPKVQYDFGVESDNARNIREARLAQVKAEARRAWSGYKKYAWTHDEVMPVSKRFRDPFCGWAATLVDSLDTLWIMGMKEEFDDAVQALKDIDFTTTPYRNDIPVFETVIRYVGGLLAAFDVSGGHSGQYHILLDKAVELVEVLMSIFDTPNRMPILYYHWKPGFASNPHRAPTSASIAEIGSMGMEFTRLAQLTGEDRYYDAVARITDALEEFQNRGTTLPGIFPQLIDASGCNMTATRLARLEEESTKAREQAWEAADLSEEPEGYVPKGAHSHSGSNSGSSSGSGSGSGSDRLARSEEEDLGTSDVLDEDPGSPAADEFHANGKRAAEEETPLMEARAEPRLSPKNTKSSKTSSPGSLTETLAAPLGANGLPLNWDCVPQGLTSVGYGSDSFSMGGSQDSAYEYFPKLYLLLGGLEPKYQTIHEKVVKAVKKYLLFRPMTKDDQDILFSAKVSAFNNGKETRMTYDYEVTHLTCFLGGMFGLGGKIFESEEDVEIGERLAAGCAWAYEVMPTGIMPEYSITLPCDSLDQCEWNQTMWEEKIDPSWSWRERRVEEYYEKKAEWEETMEDLRKQEADMKEAEEQARLQHEQLESPGVDPAVGDEDMEYLPGDRVGAELKDRVMDTDTDTSPIQKRDRVGMQDAEQDGTRERTTSNIKDGDDNGAYAKKAEAKVKTLGQELDMNSDTDSHKKPEHFGGAPSPVEKSAQKIVWPAEPTKPATHKEYVASHIANEGLQPGIVKIIDRRYILRPEAIESVWYMYRITGDPIWQERGWRMFESIIKATQTEAGHSAIGDVTRLDGLPSDNMESFWLAETLKYFYLLYTTPDVISLDDWVLNTEAHPFLRPGRKA